MNSEAQQIQEFEEVLTRFKEMMHLRGEIVIRLYTTFFDTMAATLDKLKDAIEAEECDAIKFHAHTIKGASSSLCYSAMGELAAIIEKRIETKERHEYENAFRELCAQFDSAQHNYILWMSQTKKIYN